MTTPGPQLLAPETPGVQVHASSLLVLGDDSYLVVWFAGAHEGAADSRIHVLRCTGSTTSVAVIAADDDQPHWNPVLAHGPGERLWLFFKRGWRIDRWSTWVCHSSDNGHTWTAPSELVPGDTTGGRGPVRQAPLRRGNLWLAPGSVEVWEPPRWDCFVDISADEGRTWQRVDIPLDHDGLRGAGCIQPCLVELPDGSLVVLARSTEGAVYRSVTQDPYSWPQLEPVGLPNNNSGLAAVALPDGRILACHNAAGQDWGARSTLLVSESADSGRTWRLLAALVDDPAAGDGERDGAPSGAAATGVITSGEGEHSYPSLAVSAGELWVTWTWQRRSIALTRVVL